MSARGVGLTVSLGHEFLPVQFILGSGTKSRYLFSNPSLDIIPRLLIIIV
jgi:hypothetical protein